MKFLRSTILVLLVLAIISWFAVPAIVESRNNKLLKPPAVSRLRRCGSSA